MTTYQLQVDEGLPLGKSIVALLKSASDAVTLKRVRKKAEQHSPLYYHLQDAFKDVKLMVDGKKPKQTLDDLINELRNSPD